MFAYLFVVLFICLGVYIFIYLADDLLVCILSLSFLSLIYFFLVQLQNFDICCII